VFDHTGQAQAVGQTLFEGVDKVLEGTLAQHINAVHHHIHGVGDQNFGVEGNGVLANVEVIIGTAVEVGHFFFRENRIGGGHQHGALICMIHNGKAPFTREIRPKADDMLSEL